MPKDTIFGTTALAALALLAAARFSVMSVTLIEPTRTIMPVSLLFKRSPNRAKTELAGHANTPDDAVSLKTATISRTLPSTVVF